MVIHVEHDPENSSGSAMSVSLAPPRLDLRLQTLIYCANAAHALLHQVVHPASRVMPHLAALV
jgi:hypothetical protein